MNKEKILQVLNHKYSQDLMSSNIPARLAYTGKDGFPRVIPIAFHWTGEDIVVCTIPSSPKVSSIRRNPQVALTIDTERFPPHMLLVRGTSTVEIVDGLPCEYVEASRKIVPAEGFAEWESQVRALYKQMAKITIQPEWAKLIDFETTLPSSVEEMIQTHTASTA
jgi:hypothetical protein